MAEILGLVAGAAQLLDLSARLVLASSHLYTNLKNVPEEIEALKKNTQDLYDLLWMISSDLDGPLNSHPNSLHVTHRIVSIFNDAMKESEDLAILLERLSTKGSSPAKRLWSSVAGLKERAEIVDRSRRIESLKSSIQMWYHHQSHTRLRAVENQLSIIVSSQFTAQSNLSLLAQQVQFYHLAAMNTTTLAPQHRLPAVRSRLCTCTRSHTVLHVSRWNFQFFLERKTIHSTDCPLHTDTTSWSFGLRTLSPRIQAMLGLQLGGWSLSMIGKISPHYIVDPSQSPAFVAIQEAMTKVREFEISNTEINEDRLTTTTSNGLTVLIDKGSPLDLSYQKYIDQTCVTLRSSLLQAFASGTASPADRTPDGIKVLSQFLEFTRQFNSYQDALFNLLSSTLEILIPKDSGTSSYFHHSWSAPMHVVLRRYAYKSTTGSIRLQQLRLDGILISHGIDEVSNEFRKALGHSSFVGIFNKHPCLLENYGQNPVHLAIVQRSEPKLRNLLDQGKVDLHIDNPPLLTLAIGWPAGLGMLLKAGAEPSVAIEEAILQQQLQSITLLLEHGCPIFGAMFGPYQDLLDFAIGHRVSPNVILLLVENLVERRQRLLQLALERLPEVVIETSWCDYHLHPRPLLDYNAIELYEKLKAHCVEVPEALWPGLYPTIYHSPSVHNSSSLAMKLYKLGFRDIDKCDDDGTTPLISAIKAKNLRGDDCPRLIHWYLGLGVTLGPQSVFTHILSQSTDFPALMSAGIWITKKQKLNDLLEVLRRLIHGGAQINDGCRCWCSTAGCTAVGVILRKGTWITFRDSGALKFLSRRRWLYLLPRYSSLGLDLDQACFAEVCRLEIFDRLGMAHTCCHRLEVCPQNRFPITNDERKEFQEEDRLLKDALDLYLKLYIELLQQHRGSFESFWISWWFAVDHFLPFDRPSTTEDHSYSLHLPGIPNDGPWSRSEDVTGYSPDISSLTSTVFACVRLLNPRSIDTFLSQLEPVSFEKDIYQRTILNPMRGTKHGYLCLD